MTIYLHKNFWYHYFHGPIGTNVNCTLICTDTSSTNMHTDSCYSCGTYRQTHNDNSKCEHYDYAAGDFVPFISRFDIAKQVINNMVSNLPAETHICRIRFSSRNYAMVVDCYDSINPMGDTYLMEGVDIALDQFTDDPTTRKVMIIVTDGGSDDGYDDDTGEFQAYKDNGGIVYTIGFNHDDPNLKGMTANNGTYIQASNPDDLEQVFDEITMELTAMLVDPMGSSVGFEVNSAQQPSGSVNGSIDYDSNNSTLYWRPSSSSDIQNSTFGYSYKVKLNNQADRGVGTHTGVNLNKPTNLLYGLSNDITMKSAAFPIPKATYAIPSLQVRWMSGDKALKSPTETESVICDWPGAAFTTDYSTITPSFTQDGKEYYYSGTMITKDGTQTDTVSITDAAAFIVTHQYSEVPKYHVDYEYTGVVPENAPDLNDIFGLNPGDEVTVASAPNMGGY